jgi:hypothetical protein
MVYDIDIHELNLGPFNDLNILDEISFKKCVCFSFLNNKCLITCFKSKTSPPYQRGGDLQMGIILFFFI